jgi:signal transduction histidine kinase
MLRNKEFLLYMLIASAISVLAALLCLYSALPPALVCACGCFCIIATYAVFTYRRYDNIARLSEYLSRLSHGEKSLDIRDNTEGELSILKNEIYKVTSALSEQTELLSRDKRDLANALAEISHQLKTPLTAIGVMADLLHDDELPQAKKSEFLENMRVSINRMEWLVLAMLKLARLDAGAVDFKQDRVLLSDLVQRALSALLIPIEVREQAVSVSGLDGTILCDLEWTAEALGNIIKNAIENTPAGGAICISYGANPLYASIAVRDEGPGIDKADLPHLFKRFYRGKYAGRESTGIGLSMSLAVMRKQNGDIDVAVEGGSVFTLKFYDNTVTETFTEQ